MATVVVVFVVVLVEVSVVLLMIGIRPMQSLISALYPVPSGQAKHC